MNNHFRLSTLVFAISSLTISTIGYASQQDTPSVTLDPIVVTATRTPTKTANLIAQTTVIDNADLQRYQGQTVFEVLKNQPDISIKQNGGMGTASNFYLRGYDSTQVLVLIDGIRYASLSTGQASLNLLPVEQIERIEILKGASGSSLYGADAMGGVIQIFTKKASNDNGLSATLGLGSDNHVLYRLNSHIGNDTTSLSLSSSYNKTDGINATRVNHPWGIYNADNDGFSSRNASIALHHQFNDQLNLGISGLYSKSNVDFDAGSNYHDTHDYNKNGSVQAYAEYQYADNSSIKLQYGRSIDDNKTLNTSYSPSYYNTTQDQITLVGKHQLPLGQAVYGTEYLKQSLDTKAYTTDTDRKVTSLFTGYQLTKDKLDMQANVRYDKNSQYGNETTYNVGVAYRPLTNARIGASYATGFKAPSFNDLYAWGGNPDLKAENSKNAEVFAEYNTNDVQTRLTAYHNRIDNMIASDSNYQRGNFDKVAIKGVSLTSDWNINRYLFGLGYDYQKVTDENKNSANYGNIIQYRPKHKGLVYTGYQGDNFDIRAEYQYTSDYYTDNGNSNQLKSYGLVNFAGNYLLNDHLTLNGRINNLTNKQYSTIDGYNTEGTNVFVALTYDY